MECLNGRMMLQALGGVNLPCGWYHVRGQLPSTGGQDHTHYGGNPMAETEPCTPSRADGSGSIAIAIYNIHNGQNGGLESALRAMDGMDINLGVLLETKVTDGIYT